MGRTTNRQIDAERQEIILLISNGTGDLHLTSLRFYLIAFGLLLLQQPLFSPVALPRLLFSIPPLSALQKVFTASKEQSNWRCWAFCGATKCMTAGAGYFYWICVSFETLDLSQRCSICLDRGVLDCLTCVMEGSG